MFQFTLLPAILVLAPTPILGQGDPNQSAQLEVLRGRAVVHCEGQSERLVRVQEESAWPAASVLELGAGAEARLAWNAHASWRIWGPAQVRWEFQNAKEGAESGLVFKVEELAWADVEIRRGVHRLELPSHWSAELETGAIHLRSLPSGPLEVRHHAGSPLKLQWSGDPAHVRPPVYVYPGSSLRLERPPEGPADRTSRADAWQSADWPWSESSETREQARQREELTRIQQRQLQGPEAWPNPKPTPGVTKSRVGEFQDPAGVRVQVEPHSGSPASHDSANSPGLAPNNYPAPSMSGSSKNSTQAQVTQRPQTEAPSTHSLDATQLRQRELAQSADAWRGVAFKDRARAGSVWVQRTSGVEVRALEDGRWKVLVDYSVPRPIWCFGPNEDWSLAPGSVAVFEADGHLRTSFGGVESTPAFAARFGN